MKENIYQRPMAVSLLALLCCAMWGSAFPCIKLGYAMMNISGAGSQLLYGGVRFLLAGLMIIVLPPIHIHPLYRVPRQAA